MVQIQTAVESPTPTLLQLELVTHAHGLPITKILGKPSRATKESLARATAIVKMMGYRLASKKTTINIQPQDVEKSDPSLDLAFAIGLLTLHNHLPPQCLKERVFAGQLNLSGELARSFSNKCILGSQLEFIGGDRFTRLDEIITYLKTSPTAKTRSLKPKTRNQDLEPLVQLSQTFPDLYRIILVASVQHGHVLLTGALGTGKTTAVKAIRSILPSYEHIKIMASSSHHDVFGKHGAFQSRVGRYLLLELDDLPHIKPSILLGLTSILDSSYTTNTVCCVATMNLCPCGRFGTPGCNCGTTLRKRFLKPIPAHLLDRFWIMHSMNAPKITTSSVEFDTVEKDLEAVQKNSELNHKTPQTEKQLNLFKTYLLREGLSLRRTSMTLETALTLSKLENSKMIELKHLKIAKSWVEKSPSTILFR